ncbi:hypothetical protein DAH66_09745 [Sphingomonas koreensis]|uniref:Uncharacterized protein n=1 Tax=Sphingomonas koreensis TaxID=93064 RepID=A0A430G477_9SPHN|nr:hypothetical protein [Sphingomonas koreensis]RSY85966.1 hypothetical protein DAH66_09745 [Sphingomonas koreensis]
MSEFEHVTTDAAVAVHEAAADVFDALLHEMRELSRKKPDATMSATKVKLVNSVLGDLLGNLEKEPEGKYLGVLEDESLPQVSDALLMMAQFKAALDAFEARYRRYISGKRYWITKETLAAWDAEDADPDEDRAR